MSNIQFAWLKRGKQERGIQPLLQVSGLTVKVGIRLVLENLDLDVYQGDHIHITGPNGSGKSTLLNAICGIAPARVEYGSIMFQGRDITNLATHKRTQLGIAYMRQTDIIFPNFTIAENLQLALGPEAINRFQDYFPEWMESLPLKKIAGSLSGGQRKKLGWAMTLLTDHKIMLADEPKAGVSCDLKGHIHTMLIVEHQT